MQPPGIMMERQKKAERRETDEARVGGMMKKGGNGQSGTELGGSKWSIKT